MRDGRGRAPPRNSRIQVRNEQKVITHLGEAAPNHTRYSAHNCKCVAGLCCPPRPFGWGKIVKTVRINHLRAALLAAAAAGLLAAVGLFVVVLYAQPAEANFPGKPGKIAFSGLDAPNGDYEIYTINANGGGKQPVTDNSTGDYYPTYSPSGKKIAYTGEDGPNGDPEIYTINAGGGGKKQLTDNSSDDYSPDYAPGGKRIAYTNSLTEGDEEIYTIKPDGGGRQPVTDNSSDDSSPSFSPSGKRIAYVNSTGTDSEIWTIQPNGGGRQQVTDNANNDRDPYWGSQ
jgi:hypothetical protein